MSDKGVVVVDAAMSEKSLNDHGIVEAGLSQKHLRYMTKMDLRLIPVLGVTYTLLFLDRTNSE